MQAISNLYVETNANQTAFIYVTPSEHATHPTTWQVRSPLNWLKMSFETSSYEQALEVSKAVETLSNFYNPHH